MISLEAVDSEFSGIGHNWVTVMTELNRRNIVSDKDLLTTRLLWHFGRLINNTDMHLGNLSLSMENESFRLLPVYDMCAMGFAPGRTGDVQPYDFEAPDLLNSDLSPSETTTIKNLASEFWKNVSEDPGISRQLKAFLD